MRPAWNLNRLLVVLGALSTLLASLVFAGYDLAAWAQSAPQFAPAFPGWIFAIVLVLFARPWVYLTAGILNAVLPLMVLLLFGGIFAIANPIQGAEHQSLVLLLLGLFLSLLGGIAGFVQGRRDAHTPIKGALRTPQGAGALAVVALLLGVFLTSGLAGAAVRELGAAGGGYDVAPDVTVRLNAAEFQFEPRELSVPAGQLVEIAIRNEDTAAHTFTYQYGGRTYDHFLPGDATTRILVRFAEAGEVPFWCKPHSRGAGDTDASSMVGRIVVA